MMMMIIMLMIMLIITIIIIIEPIEFIPIYLDPLTSNCQSSFKVDAELGVSKTQRYTVSQYFHQLRRLYVCFILRVQ